MSAQMQADVLADLRRLANVGEYRDLRTAMERCLRPHERKGFADLLGRMPTICAVITELIAAASEYESARREWDHVCALDPADTPNEKWRQIAARYENAVMRHLAAIKRAGGTP